VQQEAIVSSHHATGKIYAYEATDPVNSGSLFHFASGKHAASCHAPATRFDISPGTDCLFPVHVAPIPGPPPPLLCPSAPHWLTGSLTASSPCSASSLLSSSSSRSSSARMATDSSALFRAAAWAHRAARRSSRS
jgi:hypothetical protein